MPELPEVEAARRLVEATCCGRVIEDVIFLEQGGGPRDGQYDEIVIVGGGAELKAALVGRKLEASLRKGKVQYWQLSGPTAETMTTHFGMTGAFSVRGVAPPRFKRYAVDTSAWPPRFCKLEVVFSGGVRLALTDPRRLARVTRVKGDPLASPPLSALAPDAWLALPPVPAFAAALAARSMPIKALLLDQNKVVSGIGNWLIDEFLYQARLHPESLANALSPADVKALHGAIVRVLDTACAADADSEKFPHDWLFSHRWGKGKGKSTGPDGSPITFITVGGRTSAVVLKVQGAPKKKRSDAAGEADVEAAAVGAGGEGAASGKAKGKASAGKRGSGGARKAAAAAAAAAVDDAVVAPAPVAASTKGSAPAPSKKRRAAAASVDEAAAAPAPVAASTKGSAPAPSKKRRAAAASVDEAAAAPAPVAASTKGSAPAPSKKRRAAAAPAAAASAAFVVAVEAGGAKTKKGK